MVFREERRYCDVLKTVASKYIPYLQNIESRDEIKDMKYNEIILRKYFYGKITKPMKVNVFKVNFFRYPNFQFSRFLLVLQQALKTLMTLKLNV